MAIQQTCGRRDVTNKKGTMRQKHFRRRRADSASDEEIESAVRSKLLGIGVPVAGDAVGRDWEEGLDAEVQAPQAQRYVSPTRNVYEMRKAREDARREEEETKRKLAADAPPPPASPPPPPPSAQPQPVDTEEAAMERIAKELEQEGRCKLFVGGLAYEVEDSDLREIFTQAGDLVSASVVTKDDGKGGRESRGFGFVVYKNGDDAEAAVKELNQSRYFKRMLIVKHSEMSEVCFCVCAPNGTATGQDQMQRQLVQRMRQAGFGRYVLSGTVRCHKRTTGTTKPGAVVTAASGCPVTTGARETTGVRLLGMTDAMPAVKTAVSGTTDARGTTGAKTAVSPTGAKRGGTTGVRLFATTSVMTAATIAVSETTDARVGVMTAAMTGGRAGVKLPGTTGGSGMIGAKTAVNTIGATTGGTTDAKTLVTIGATGAAGTTCATRGKLCAATEAKTGATADGEKGTAGVKASVVIAVTNAPGTATAVKTAAGELAGGVLSPAWSGAGCHRASVTTAPTVPVPRRRFRSRCRSRPQANRLRRSVDTTPATLISRMLSGGARRRRRAGCVRCPWARSLMTNSFCLRRQRGTSVVSRLRPGRSPAIS